MAVHNIKWQINQSLVRLDRMNWDQVMDHFLKYVKSLCDFCAYFHEVYTQGMF